MIAAFDDDGNGYLNFEEVLALVQTSSGCRLPRQEFEQMCENVGADL